MRIESDNTIKITFIRMFPFAEMMSTIEPYWPP